MTPDDGRSEVAAPCSRLLEHYEAVAAASQSMLGAARADRWDEVAQWEEHCLTLIAALKEASETVLLEPHEDERRVHLLRRILAADAEIRSRAEPWWAQLDDIYQGRVATPHCATH